MVLGGVPTGSIKAQDAARVAENINNIGFSPTLTNNRSTRREQRKRWLNKRTDEGVVGPKTRQMRYVPAMRPRIGPKTVIVETLLINSVIARTVAVRHKSSGYLKMINIAWL
jgi:hypothetical protein